jgi:deazaflavin-dependent oxidoreductase (nitroreductase family)
MVQVPAVDPTQPPTRFKRLMTSIALSRPGTWFYINVASRLDPWLIRATRGRIDSSMGVVPIVLLTARGARSGIKRTVPLLYFTDRDDVILMASSFGRPRYPAWYHNLKAHPEVSLHRRGRTGSYVAHEVDSAERDRLYKLAKQLYSGYGVYEGRVAGVRRVPVLRLSPAAASLS